jgi:4'-phosphopantetheinyl transferase
MNAWSSKWPGWPGRVVVSRDEVHVWRLSLEEPLELVPRLALTLSSEERCKAERFRFVCHRNQFIFARGFLRRVVAFYLDCEPHAVQFSYSSKGKPQLDRSFHQTTVSFNLSHSNGLAMLAIGDGIQIGIDVEFVRPICNVNELAERFFSPNEVTAFRTFPDSQRLIAFYTCWTRKEAFVKASGDGLTCPLDSFDVSFADGKPAKVMGIAGSERKAAQWSIRELAPAHGYVAAVAYKGPDVKLTYLQGELVLN